MIVSLLLCTAALVSSTNGAVSSSCLTKKSPCSVDDSKFPPYNAFAGTTEDQCQQACLDASDRGILVNELGQLVQKYCQVATFQGGVCKLYFEEGITTTGSKVFRFKRQGYGGQSDQSGYGGQSSGGQSGGQGGYGGDQSGQGGQGGYGGGGQGGQVGPVGPTGVSSCFVLQFGQPGCPGSTAGGTTVAPISGVSATTVAGATTPSAAPSCFTPKKATQLDGNAYMFLIAKGDFDGTVADCQAKCKADPKCLSVNYYPATDPTTDPAQCILHDTKCSPTDTTIVCEDRTNTEYYEVDRTQTGCA